MSSTFGRAPRSGRRDFLAKVLVLAFPWPFDPAPGLPASRKPIADGHVHLFGAGDAGSGCRLSAWMRGGFAFRFLSLAYGLGRRGATVDEAYLDLLLEHARASGLDRILLLAQDGVYDGRGNLDEARTHVLVPNEYLFRVTGAHPDLFVPCPSINPDRRDALEELERCASRGAKALKIHPPIQGVDLSDRRHEPFFLRCAELGMKVLVHTGHEHSAPVVDIRLADPRKVERALAAGCTVVACHSGTGRRGERPDFLEPFLSLARKYPRLWGDTSILGTPGRGRDVRRLLAAKDILPRLLHGSDFPFPAVPLAFAARIGAGRALALQFESNALKRDLALKVALGFSRSSAEEAHRTLAAGAAGTDGGCRARRPV